MEGRGCRVKEKIRLKADADIGELKGVGSFRVCKGLM